MPTRMAPIGFVVPMGHAVGAVVIEDVAGGFDGVEFISDIATRYPYAM